MRAPPLVLSERIVTITRPQPAPISVSLPPRVTIDVPWPRLRVTGASIPPAPGVIRLHGPPQGPWRQPLPAVVRYLLAEPL